VVAPPVPVFSIVPIGLPSSSSSAVYASPSLVGVVLSLRIVSRPCGTVIPVCGRVTGAVVVGSVTLSVLNDDLADDFDRWYPGFNQLLAPIP